MYGYIHSIETCGTVDGPGIRYIVFMQGCNLKCIYCHNPDTWSMNKENQITPEELFENVLKYRNFIKNGGVTVSGGEPLIQKEFVLEFFKLLKKNGIHTAIDTSASVNLDKVKEVFKYTDLILLDIKSVNTSRCKDISGKGNENCFSYLDYAKENNIKVWIRHVVISGYTDSIEDAKILANKLKLYKNCIERVEINPFHNMAKHKWSELGLNYTLSDLNVPDKVTTGQIKEVFRESGIYTV